MAVWYIPTVAKSKSTGSFKLFTFFDRILRQRLPFSVAGRSSFKHILVKLGYNWLLR